MRRYWSGVSCDQNDLIFIDGKDLLEKLNLSGDVLAEKDMAADVQGPLFHRMVAKTYYVLTKKYVWGLVNLKLANECTPNDASAPWR